MTFFCVELQVRNVSHTLQQVRVVPLLSKTFHVSQASLPGPDSIIAPGMHASLRVIFTPDSLGNFTDTLKISTPLSSISVPLNAIRATPTLDLPPELDLGPEYVGGDAATRTVHVTAIKGSGTFRIMAAVDWAEGAVYASAESSAQLPNGFSVQPAEFALSAGCKQQLTFSFLPTACGTPFREKVAPLHVACWRREHRHKFVFVFHPSWLHAMTCHNILLSFCCFKIRTSQHLQSSWCAGLLAHALNRY